MMKSKKSKSSKNFKKPYRSFNLTIANFETWKYLESVQDKKSVQIMIFFLILFIVRASIFAQRYQRVGGLPFDSCKVGTVTQSTGTLGGVGCCECNVGLISGLLIHFVAPRSNRPPRTHVSNSAASL